ncbi:MAG: M23 family metallopeptidase [Bacteroidales bacterium]|jgi:murein DD-endopeptidase MepM/ murein hydrolase activator NlpD|nr:M23 family metallopeptidase [Bacteroidales bacterium]MDD2263624.1 M23 family metallopeptidase [Bacteroidales bacterium]MDD2830585.1 M23 family metallopeptidase [Bacteroidales bacterium]MDD3208854.1 M23 family metallopeptidase [Bacteroidales bacterium]MDD3697421.1 M23 family metallopeptidase [Bacteroidales bacterium]
MEGRKKYKYNPETLSYELQRPTLRFYLLRILIILPVSLIVALGYYMLYTEGLKLKTPRTARLEREYNNAKSGLELLNKQIAQSEKRLENLQLRDNSIYRNIFGMEQIPPEVRNAGFGGSNRYPYLEYADNSKLLMTTALNFDKIMKKAYIQSRSFDDVERVAGQVGEVAKCIPSILPIPEDTRNFRWSGAFGYRKDPIYGDIRMHEGIDLTGAPNSPVYATGDGKIESIRYEYNGYGRYILVDHGFGYKTRYAHLNDALVYEGQLVKRGERIGLLGSTGKSTGPHVHYEVIYMGRPVNPYNYFNNNIASNDYHAVILGGRQ